MRIEKYLNESYQDYVKHLKSQGWKFIDNRYDDNDVMYSILEKDNRKVAIKQDEHEMNSIQSQEEIKKLHKKVK